MSDFFDIMIVPFAACLVLTGVHTYLGLHVVQRGVIFVDLALAQIAAFGATAGFALGFSLQSGSNYLCSLAAALTGAGLLSVIQNRNNRVPQEALIGVVYVVAAACAILVLSRAPEGGAELQSLLVGHLLTVDWPEVRKVIVLYGIVGVIHFWAFPKLYLLSVNREQAVASGLQATWWDFVFYGTFALVVTSSTKIAGVLLVFAFLIVPALCGRLLADSVRGRLLVGWTIGFIGSVLGILGSFYFDLPTGAAVVCALGMLLFLVILLPSRRLDGGRG